jgi:prepilin-type N-terminal cleavage/methylation domain-containing protein
VTNTNTDAFAATAAVAGPDRPGEAGFTLIETTCAMVIILISLLGVAFSFTYAINYNAGNQSRAQALALLQQEVEQIRAAKFTPNVTDPALSGGVKAARSVVSPTGTHFTVQVTVDNDPFTTGVQDDAARPNSTLKEITVITRLEAPSPGWQTAVPATVVIRRTRSN